MHRDTKLTRYGRGTLPSAANPGILRASTILHGSVAALKETKAKREDDDSVLSYGRRGTTTAHALADAIRDLEGGDGCFLYPSGVAAIAGVLGAFLRPGDHVLLIEDVFHHTLTYCEQHLKSMGISMSIFPWDTTDLTAFIRPETKLAVLEAPTSNTLRTPDLPALCESAHAHGVVTATDNTYGSGWHYRPLELGSDISMISGTKYLSGHADTMMGAVVAKGDCVAALRHHTHLGGQLLAPDEAYACLRGMRTLSLRMERHEANGLAIARWLDERREVQRVWHPALPGTPGHDTWTRDASGTNGLVSLRLCDGIDAEAFVDALDLFPVGSSWGGFESLAILLPPSSGSAPDERPQVRLHAGLEHIDDLIADLELALENVA